LKGTGFSPCGNINSRKARTLLPQAGVKPQAQRPACPPPHRLQSTLAANLVKPPGTPKTAKTRMNTGD